MMISSGFVCWSCGKVYNKKISDTWLYWKCPLCGKRTSGTSGEKDKQGNLYTLSDDYPSHFDGWQKTD
jgi:predicted RNA-binding Zn-ribbon protein involved in translation (DUF1610 family)